MAPRLIAITDVTVLAGAELVARLRRLAAQALPSTIAILLRDHALSAKQRLALGAELSDVARAAGQELWVADRLDLALLLRADVAHLGEASVSARRARELLPTTTRISRAWHATTWDGANVAELQAVDALLVSPVLAPRKGRPELGLRTLSTLGEQLRARNQASTPSLYALGGVSSANAAACLAAGATGVAAIGAALAPDATPLLAALQILK